MRITAQTLTLNGNILADGGGGYYGGGSGGGIRIDADTVAGSGKIYARGGASGNGSYFGGAGGGGRIAVYYGTMSLPVGNILAHGGKCSYGNNSVRNGGAGTIYLKAIEEDRGELIIDNKGVAVNSATSPLRAIGRGLINSITPSSLAVSSNRWSAKALVGLHVKPNVNRQEVFTLIDNNTTTLFTDPAEGDLGWWALVGSTFSGVYRFDRMTVAGKARVNCADMFEITDELVVDDASLVSGGMAAGRITTVNGGTVEP